MSILVATSPLAPSARSEEELPQMLASLKGALASKATPLVFIGWRHLAYSPQSLHHTIACLRWRRPPHARHTKY